MSANDIDPAFRFNRIAGFLQQLIDDEPWTMRDVERAQIEVQTAKREYKLLLKKVKQLQDRIKRFDDVMNASDAVMDNWESGDLDLASAANNLEGAVAMARQR